MDLNAANSYGTILFCHIILPLKLDVPWGQWALASMAYKFFEKTSGGSIKNESMSNTELAEELHKPIIKI